MERRRTIIAAAATSATLLAGAAGIALSSGIVGAAGNDDVGQLSPVGATSNPPVTLYDDSGATTAGSFGDSDSTGSRAGTYEDDDHHDDGHDDGSEADDRYEYEGAEDDD